MRRHPSKVLAPYQSDRCRATSPEVSFPASPPTCGSGHKQMLAAVRFPRTQRPVTREYPPMHRESKLN